MAAVPSPQRSLDELLTRAGDMPVLPHVVFRLMEVSSFDDHSCADIEKSVMVDPGFAVRVLRRANGSKQGQDDVLSIREAVRQVGSRSVVELATSAGSCFDAFIGKNDAASLRKRAWWRHSLDTAVCCSYVAQRSGLVHEDDAYTAGLLYFLGKTLLNRLDPDRYDRVEAHVSEGMTETEAEARLFGWSHIEVAGGALARWNLPARLGDAMDYESEDTQQGGSLLRACLCLSHTIARHAIAGGTDCTMPTWAKSLLGFSDEVADDVCDGARNAIASAELAQF